MKSYTSHSLADTASAAQDILLILSKKKSDQATVVGLSGHLGAGKTAFVKEAAKILGITEDITSPTFVIMKLFPLSSQPWQQLVHIDAYRLEKGKELEAINFKDLVANSGNLILIEWPEQVSEALSGLENYSKVTFTLDQDNQDRTIVLE